MPSTKASKGKGKIVWTRDLKLCLHLLQTEFDLQRKQRVQVFNIVFEQYLTSCGLTEGTVSNTIESQYAERKKPTARDWATICQPPANARDIEAREALAARIREALSSLESGSTYRPTPSTQRHANGASSSNRIKVATATTSTPVTPTRFRDAIATAAYNPLSTPEQVTQPSAVVVIPRSPTTTRASQLPTPSKSKSKSKSPRIAKPSTPKVPYRRNDGSTIMVSPRAFKAIEKRVQPVPEWKAHPPLPGLLFRYWHEDPSCNRDSRNRFWARKYHDSNVRAHIPPNSRSIDPVDIFNHMDRKMEKSPFISTSSRLIWIIQLLIKGLKHGNGTGRLSVIDASALDKRTVSHARPFHDAIVKTHGFSNGAWHYPGTYEFLVWKKIPRHAVVHTFEAEEFLELAASNGAIRDALRLDVLRLPHKGLTKTKVPMLQKGSVELTNEIVAGLAELCVFFGLDAYSSPKHISHIVSDVIEGWALKVEHREEAAWYKLATVFARHVCKRTTPPVTLVKDMEMVKLAFLDGVAWGTGKPNATHKTELITMKNRSAKAAGLADPLKVVTDQLDAAKLAVMAFQKTEIRKLEQYHHQKPSLLPAPEIDEGVEDEVDMLDDEDVEMETEEDVEPTTPMQVDEDDQIIYEDDQIIHHDDDDEFVL